MRAAVIRRIGDPPAATTVPEPARRGPGQALVEVGAAPLNPVDLHIASGRYHAGEPTLPYIAGREGVGTVIEGDRLQPGRRVHFLARSGYGADGALAERAVVEEAATIEIDDDGVPDGLAAALGIPAITGWLAVEWRAGLRSGEHVLVLGATGALGQAAVQAARLLGAGRVVAAGRDAEALRHSGQLGADATVELAPDLTVDALAGELRAAAQDRLDVVIDPLWGPPAEAASLAASAGARIVNLGAAASNRATLLSSTVRGGMLTVLGLSLFSSPPEVIGSAYRALLRHAAAGRLAAGHELLPLSRIAEAWERQRSSPHLRLVIDPRL